MSSERKLTITYTLNPPEGTITPLSKKTGQSIPPSDTIAFSVSKEGQVDYKQVVAAIQQAKEITGINILTPWRDAVGDKEAGKDQKKTTTADSPDEEDEDEESNAEAA
ncbi:11643_t:CDS:1 [Acaulospora colombiana]|uniref:11643_t:CDS:1 n=1 Tax=Acaulospora colombiana TaxID=27376 RepID=A0ACA9L5L7_9GLOM|nr:11643_t:CDS:1 [Acaulospora colombiana]